MQRAYLKAVNELQLGSLAYQRDKKLVGEGVIADRRWQETQSQYNFFVAQVNEQKQLLSIAGMTNSEIDRLTATHQLSGLLNVYAPISGVVIERMIAAGERVQMQAPLYRIANLNELWLRSMYRLNVLLILIWVIRLRLKMPRQCRNYFNWPKY